MGRAAASCWRKPSSSFSCCGRKGKKVKSWNCSKKFWVMFPTKNSDWHLYISTLWWQLWFLVLNWVRKRISAPQASSSAEDRFPITSRKTAIELKRPVGQSNTYMSTCTQTHVHAQRLYTYQTPLPASVLCLATPTIIQVQTFLGLSSKSSLSY